MIVFGEVKTLSKNEVALFGSQARAGRRSALLNMNMKLLSTAGNILSPNTQRQPSDTVTESL
jgi:hypothetical protein